MPIPLTPGNDGAPGAVPSLPATPPEAPPAAAQAAPQQVQVESVVRPLATSLPAWDLLPPGQVLAFRRRA